MIRDAAILMMIFLAASAAMAQIGSAGDAAKRLHALFDEDWQWRLKEYPEFATLLGDNRYNDRLTDYSMEAIERRKAHAREMLDRIQKIDRSQLAGQDIISYDLFLRDKMLEVEGQRFFTELMPINQMQGPHIEFGQLITATPFRTARDYLDYLERLRAFPRLMSQMIALMERGMAAGWVPPSEPLRSVPSQIEGQIADDPVKSP
ncbi:MAG TPA: DUF885 family protein, partial [Blastocatellia bacterium]|nr:DUF885 family protein [Blastocatellia bacterium]